MTRNILAKFIVKVSKVIYLLSITRVVLAQSLEPEAHDKGLIQIELEFGNVGF